LLRKKFLSTFLRLCFFTPYSAAGGGISFPLTPPLGAEFLFLLLRLWRLCFFFLPFTPPLEAGIF
jgi:hypothetical protein